MVAGLYCGVARDCFWLKQLSECTRRDHRVIRRRHILVHQVNEKFNRTSHRFLFVEHGRLCHSTHLRLRRRASSEQFFAVTTGSGACGPLPPSLCRRLCLRQFNARCDGHHKMVDFRILILRLLFQRCRRPRSRRRAALAAERCAAPARGRPFSTDPVARRPTVEPPPANGAPRRRKRAWCRETSKAASIDIPAPRCLNEGAQKTGGNQS